jgi:hypothetical protein
MILPVFAPTLFMPKSAYVGPGDIATFSAWSGLRAFTAAIAAAGTQTVVNLRRDSDNATADVLVAANGGLGLTANGSIGGINGLTVSAFKGAANLFVTEAYDQTGNTVHLTQTTAANQPGLNLSGIGSLPTVTFNGTNQWISNSTTTPTLAQPNSSSHVLNFTGGQSDSRPFASDDGVTNLISFAFAVDNTFIVYDGNVSANIAATDGNTFAIQIVWNGASTSVDVNGSSSTVNAGGNSLSTNLVWGSNHAAGASFPFVGFATEQGIASGSFSAGQQSSLTSNQRAFWGF